MSVGYIARSYRVPPRILYEALDCHQARQATDQSNSSLTESFSRGCNQCPGKGDYDARAGDEAAMATSGPERSP